MPICAAGLGTVGGIKTFLYLHCDDLAAARRFYTGLLGLDEIYYSDGDGTVGYTIGTLQVSVAAHPQAIPIDGWSQQLGWEGGDSTTPSLGIEFDSDSFRRVVGSLHGSEVSAWREEPFWVGYWSFPVKDPMGYTVEVSSSEPDAWPT